MCYVNAQTERKGEGVGGGGSALNRIAPAYKQLDR